MRTRKHLTRKIKLLLLCGMATLLLSLNGIAQFRINSKLITDVDSVANVCVNTSVRFSATVAGTISWLINGGNPTTGSGALTYNIFNNIGTYKVEQTVTTPDTSFKKYATVIVSDTYPQASFSVVSPASLCGSETFTFKNTTAGPASGIFWNFGPCANNGTAFATDNFSLSFSKTIGNDLSDCPVQLIIVNTLGCSDTVSNTIQVKQFPDVNINDVDGAPVNYLGTPTFSSCGVAVPFLNTFYNFSSTTATNDNYNLLFKDNNSSFDSSDWRPNGVAHSFKEGTTPVIVKVKGQNGCTAEKNYGVYVSVQSKPNVSLSGPPPGLICAPQNIEFVINQNGNSSETFYKLNLNDNLSSGSFNNPPPAKATVKALSSSCGIESTDGTTIYPNAIKATVVAQNPCGTATASVLPIYASSKPKAGINSPTSLCSNTAGLIGRSGNYGSVVSVLNGKATCTSDGKHAWTISPATYIVDSGSLGNTNNDFTSINSWQTGTDTFKIRFTDTGIYTIKQYIGNATCGIDSISKTICISIPSQAAFTLNTRQGCPGNTIFKTNNSTPPPTGQCGGEFFTWQVAPINTPSCTSGTVFNFTNGTTANSKDVDITFGEKGMYEIKLISRLSALSPCATQFVDTIYIYEKPSASITSIAEICTGDLFSPTAVSADCLPNKLQTYTWKFLNGTPAAASGSNPVGIKFNIAGNTYMTLETSNVCGTDRDTANILVNAKPVLNQINDTTICSNNSLNILLASSSGSGTVYTWKSTVISGSGVAGNTSLSKQDVLSITDKLTNSSSATAIVEYKIVAEPTVLPFKCPSDSAVVYVTVLPQIVASQDTLLCIGKTLQLNAAGIGIVQWNWTPAASLNNATTANPTTNNALTTSTMFYVTGTTALGCNNTDSVMVTVTPPFNLAVTPKNALSCVDSAVQLQASGGGSYTWSPATGLSDPNIANPIAKPSQTTTYTVTSVDVNNCETKTDFATITVGGFTNVDVNSSSVGTVLAGTRIPLFASTDSANIDTYNWSVNPSDGATLECQNAAICSQQLATIYKDVTFSVQVENIYGCIQTDTISFKASCISDKQLFVPTAFSPDGNSLNDVFTILGQGFTINYFRIYNRWGSVVFERTNGGKPNDKNYGWNGRLKDGGTAPSGIYTCVVEVACTAGGIFSYKGNVTLIR